MHVIWHLNESNIFGPPCVISTETHHWLNIINSYVHPSGLVPEHYIEPTAAGGSNNKGIPFPGPRRFAHTLGIIKDSRHKRHPYTAVYLSLFTRLPYLWALIKVAGRFFLSHIKYDHSDGWGSLGMGVNLDRGWFRIMAARLMGTVSVWNCDGIERSFLRVLFLEILLIFCSCIQTVSKSLFCVISFTSSQKFYLLLHTAFVWLTWILCFVSGWVICKCGCLNAGRFPYRDVLFSYWRDCIRVLNSFRKSGAEIRPVY